MKLLHKTLIGLTCVSMMILFVNGDKNLKQIGGIPGLLPPNDSITIGYAANNNQMLQSAAGFITPTYMERIPIHLNNPYTGVMAEASGVKKHVINFSL